MLDRCYKILKKWNVISLTENIEFWKIKNTSGDIVQI